MKSVEILTLVRPIGLVLYFFLASQGAFYQVGFGKALFDISPEGFIELRKAVDPRVRENLKAIYLSSLVIMVIWLALTIRSGGLFSYGSVLAAFLLLVADLVLALKASEPVNELINSGLLNTRKGYINARAEWMKYIFIRGNLVIVGFVILLLGLVL
ncbi:hypothetical protein LZD49_15460 [Dyadobacter sp. CY261]|uniref:hypothetical protein n=1 Tax=Dyadobacter sp. CY261 TaxID=2907203 RepID=UPI001F1EA52A|nr:hypothetical protein [Dyadobacter sp. CY261]MCF0071874.1 hypothetical protein [Dyadobacter sp. CY261]